MNIVIKERRAKRFKVTRTGRKSGGAYLQINEEACVALEKCLNEIAQDVNIKDLASALIVAAAKDATFTVEVRGDNE